MPQKPKLHKHKGKNNTVLNKIPKAKESVTDNDTNQLHNNHDEAVEQFEVELCWCIQQLQSLLSSGKLNQKQAQENTKILNTLMSNSTPFIKKRQVMRLTFGDYRAKMQEENKKISKALTMKIGPSSPSKNSKFMKKASFSSNPNEFKFNFKLDDSEDTLPDNISKIEIENDNSVCNTSCFISSGNQFRFNFNVDEV